MNGIDCSTRLTASSALALKQAGIDVAGRYLGRNLWNGLTPDEVKAIQGAGIALFSDLGISSHEKVLLYVCQGYFRCQCSHC